MDGERQCKHILDEYEFCFFIDAERPRRSGERGQMTHAQVGEAGENSQQIISGRDFQPATGFDHRLDLDAADSFKEFVKQGIKAQNFGPKTDAMFAKEIASIRASKK